ncbi:MAG: hypothetical protein N2204_09075, partial [Anaerolineae bacterium]|nr:hypothetical protein [Anaerolineae bacterium]
MKRSRVWFAISLVLMDAVMSILAFFVAYLIRAAMRGPEVGPFRDHLLPATIQVLAILTVFFFYKFYHRRHAALLLDEVYRLIGAVSVATLVTIAFMSFVLRETLQYQRSIVALAWASSIVLISLG